MGILGMLATAAIANIAISAFESWAESESKSSNYYGQRHYRNDIIEGNCPHCKAVITVPITTSAYKCPSCNRAFIVFKCSGCANYLCIPTVGPYKCFGCETLNWVGLCSNRFCNKVDSFCFCLSNFYFCFCFTFCD